ncbi:MAG: hypothetical protein ACRDZX_08840, partial [Acidimicrobiales bacterium]
APSAGPWRCRSQAQGLLDLGPGDRLTFFLESGAGSCDVDGILGPYSKVALPSDAQVSSQTSS